MNTKWGLKKKSIDGLLRNCDFVIFTYRIDVIWTPLLNRTPSSEKSNRTPVIKPDLSQKLVKSLSNLNWTPPKNQFWKIEHRSCNKANTVFIKTDLNFIVSSSDFCCGFVIIPNWGLFWHWPGHNCQIWWVSWWGGRLRVLWGLELKRKVKHCQ